MKQKINLEKIIQIFVSCLILILLVRYINLQELVMSLRKAKLEYLIFILLLLPLNFFFRAVRWSLIINKDKKLLSLKILYSLTFVGSALNIVLSGGLGDVGRSYYGYKYSGLKEEMLSSSLIDKIVAVFTIFILGGLTALICGFYHYLILSFVGVLLFGVVLFFPMLIPWDFLNRIIIFFTRRSLDADQLSKYSKISNVTLLNSILLSTVAWLLTYIQFYLICLGFSVNVGLGHVLTFAPLITLARMVPFTFGGLGTQEATVVYLFNSLGIDTGVAFLISLMFTFILVVIPGLIGWFVILNINKSSRLKAA